MNSLETYKVHINFVYIYNQSTVDFLCGFLFFSLLLLVHLFFAFFLVNFRMKNKKKQNEKKTNNNIYGMKAQLTFIKSAG